MRPLLIPLLLAFPAPAAAAERMVGIGSYDRVRVEGPLEVRLTTGAAPGVRVVGEPAALEAVQVRLEGGTLIVRPFPRSRSERSFASAPPVLPRIEAATGTLRSAGVLGGATLTIAGPLAVPRVDLSVTGNGAITTTGLNTAALGVTLIGEGTITLGGTAGSARMLANGGGAIAARDLTVNEALIRTEGPVAVELTARYTVTASSTGKGPITILGNPECKVRAAADGPIVCRNQKKF